MKSRPDTNDAICRNRQARFKYEILATLECGIVLRGTEVKSLRGHRGSLDEAFARLHGGELWLHGFHIAVYDPAADANHDPIRVRKLLATKHEIHRITPKLQERGLTLVPLRAYFGPRGWVKIELALAKGKARHDKRQALKEREHRREIRRATRGRR